MVWLNLVPLSCRIFSLIVQLVFQFLHPPHFCTIIPQDPTDGVEAQRESILLFSKTSSIRLQGPKRSIAFLFLRKQKEERVRKPFQYFQLWLKRNSKYNPQLPYHPSQVSMARYPPEIYFQYGQGSSSETEPH